MSAGKELFPTLLAGYRRRSGWSRNALSHMVGVDPSYLSRIEGGYRDPPREHIVEALARSLGLTELERNRLLVAAGYAPVDIAWNDTLQAVADVLRDWRLRESDREEFRFVISALVRRWQKAGT